MLELVKGNFPSITILQYITIYYNILQYITIYYNILQYITIYYNILQYITIYYNNGNIFNNSAGFPYHSPIFPDA